MRDPAPLEAGYDAEGVSWRMRRTVPDAERRCTVCGNARLDALGEGKRTTVWEFVPARQLGRQVVTNRTVCDRCLGPGIPGFRLAMGSALGFLPSKGGECEPPPRTGIYGEP